MTKADIINNIAEKAKMEILLNAFILSDIF